MKGITEGIEIVQEGILIKIWRKIKGSLLGGYSLNETESNAVQDLFISMILLFVVKKDGANYCQKSKDKNCADTLDDLEEILVKRIKFLKDFLSSRLPKNDYENFLASIESEVKPRYRSLNDKDKLDGIKSAISTLMDY